VLDILRRGVVELLEERGDHLVEQKVARFLRAMANLSLSEDRGCVLT
jgi:hypothetical protein